jgi:hypothetical protein
MRFEIGPFKDSLHNAFRSIGYHFVSERGGEFNFIRPLGGSSFPRFDIYLKKDGDKFSANLHIDQKRPIYGGQTAHAGEYEGEILEKEAERIKKSI